MKTKLLFLTALLTQLHCFAQAPAIQWQKNVGGLGNDVANSIQKTTDGGYIVAGYTDSNDTDVTGNHGEEDFWVVKFSETGNIQWQKTYGGSRSEEATSIQQTADGGYIVAGFTNSIDGDVTGVHYNAWEDPTVFTRADFWVIKLNSTGIMEWQKTLGGAYQDKATSIKQSLDGGFIVVGEAGSMDGDIGLPTLDYSTHQYNGWVVKLDASGTIEWQHLLFYHNPNYNGGQLWTETWLNSIQQTSDGGYIIGNNNYYSTSNGIYSYDSGYFSVTKLSGTGATEWIYSYAINPLAPYGYGVAESIQPTTDGGYIVAGEMFIQDDIGNYIRKGLVIKLDSTGLVVWEKSIGGTNNDFIYSIKQTLDGGYIMAGSTASTDGDIISNHGGTDAWVIKLNTTGIIEWQKTIGGTLDDFARDIVETSNGEYVVAGSSYSSDGDLTGNLSNQDLWVVKLGAPLSTNAFEKNKISVYPNPTKNQINLQLPNQVKVDKIVISDLTGKVILEQTSSTNQVDVSQIANGMYILQTFSGKDKYQSKFIKE